MAYAALVSLQHVLEQILDRDEDQDSFIPHDLHKIKSLHETIICLVAFLDDFPEDAGASLEGRIRNAANQVEDIVEGQISDDMHMDYRWWDVMCCIEQVVLFVFPAHQIAGSAGLKLHEWQKLLSELQGVTKELEDIVEEVLLIKSRSRTKDLVSGDTPAATCGSSLSRLAPSGEGTVVGLDKDLMEIKGRLYGEPSKLRIISITGMGGIGKTTLARYAYDDSLMKYHFDVHAWVTVSQHCSIRNSLSRILYSMYRSNKEEYHKMSEEKLVENLYKFLKGRRYLIVMDDVWDASVWDASRHTFPSNFNGSQIMITSRHLDVASDIDPSNHPHQMNLMDTNQSWNPLREKVFAHEHCPPNLQQIGEIIVKECGGIPLAIVVIAGILSKASRMQGTWESIARNINKVMNSGDDKFAEILSLSYRHLPHRLRACFLYMGGFSKGYKISVSKLVKLWVAEGFLKSHRYENLEEVANEYLEDLVKRNLVMVSKRKHDGKSKMVRIHDLLWDLCLKKAHEEKFLQVISKCSLGLPDGSTIRTILLPLHNFEYRTWRCFKLLRILDASTTVSIVFVPEEIGELLHLRYIAFTILHTGKFKVPRSLSNLRNLQTLIIMPFWGKLDSDVLYLLPIGIWRLSQLRHLILFKATLPNPCLGALTTLKNLRTLSCVTSFTCSDRILELVPNLNKLEIFYQCSDISKTGLSKYKLNNLVHFLMLEELNIHVEKRELWDFRIPFLKCCFPTLHKSNITFPVALKKLTLRGCKLSWEDMTIIGSLPNLEVLKLRGGACHGHIWKTTEGEFCRLKVLVIEGLYLMKWIVESSHFPCLQQLHIYYCPAPDEIPYCIGDIPTLELIELDYCNESMVESAKRIEEEQWDLGNDDLRVRILHS